MVRIIVVARTQRSIEAKIHKNPLIEIRRAKTSGKSIIMPPTPPQGDSTAFMASLIFSDSDFSFFFA